MEGKEEYLGDDLGDVGFKTTVTEFDKFNLAKKIMVVCAVVLIIPPFLLTFFSTCIDVEYVSRIYDVLDIAEYILLLILGYYFGTKMHSKSKS